MKALVYRSLKVVVGISLTLPALSLLAGGSTKPAAAKPAADAKVLAAFAPAEIPQSVFVISGNPRECRNPFFPRSATPAPAPKSNAGAVDARSIMLNGITSPPKRTAMINGTTFEQGEEHELRLPGGSRMLIKCEEIRDDSAIILVSGVRRELKLRSGVY